MPIRQTLAHIPTDRPVAVMLRHAERFPIVTVDGGWDARLTVDGHAAAISLGTAVAAIWRSNGVTSTRLCASPIPRCGETAARFAEGLRGAGLEIADAIVVDDLAGPYLHDVNSVMKIVLSKGDQSFVRAWFDGAMVPDMLVAAPVAARGQVDVMLKSLDVATDGVDVHVSHDWNILLIREHFVGLRHEDVGMPGFLDGLAVWRDGDEVVVAYGTTQRRHQL